MGDYMCTMEIKLPAKLNAEKISAPCPKLSSLCWLYGRPDFFRPVAEVTGFRIAGMQQYMALEWWRAHGLDYCVTADGGRIGFYAGAASKSIRVDGREMTCRYDKTSGLLIVKVAGSGRKLVRVSRG